MQSRNGDTSLEYDQVLVDIVNYVYVDTVDSKLAYERARIALLDALGCAVETITLSPECRAFLGPVLPGTIVPNGFRLPGTCHQLDPIKGAFDLGSLIRYLDHNDAFPGIEWGHPSDNLGALISISDWLSRSTAGGQESQQLTVLCNIKTLLTAQIKAYEIQGTFQILNSFNAQGLDHTILVKVASTVLVSYLLGLPKSGALDALSQAWQDGHPLRTFRQSPNAGPRKGWAAGDACSRAVHLALLTKAGQPGAPTVLTAPKWGFYDALFGGKEFVLPRPYKSWVMENVFFKLITAEGHGISAVEAAVKIAQILRERDLTPERDIKSITIRTQKAAKTIIDKSGPLRNSADRDHCLQYMVGVVLLKNSVIETVDYMDNSPWACDPRVDFLRNKMTVVEDDGFTRDYHDHKVRSGANGIKVNLYSGVEIPEVVVEFPIGHPKREDTLERVTDKFKLNMRRGGFEEERIENIIGTVTDDDLPVCSFIDLFIKDDLE